MRIIKPPVRKIHRIHILLRSARLHITRFQIFHLYTCICHHKNRRAVKLHITANEKIRAIYEHSSLRARLSRKIIAKTLRNYQRAAKLTADFADTCQRCPWIDKPCPDYELTSLRGKIKRTQARLDELDKRTEQAQQPAEGTKFSGGEIVRNLEADRLQILFDEKPDEETRAALKQNGFRWSPRYSAWQRQLTQNAEIAARRALGLTE